MTREGDTHFKRIDFDDLLRADGPKGAIWAPPKVDAGGTLAELRCPECGGLQRLVRSHHKIHAGGVIKPSLVCAHKDRGCKFHKWATLDGWDGPVEPEPKP